MHNRCQLQDLPISTLLLLIYPLVFCCTVHAQWPSGGEKHRDSSAGGDASTTNAVPASAACNDKRVQRLAKAGKTVASIARDCDMSKDDVRSVLDKDEEGEEQEAGLRVGTPLGPCGCWGYVDPAMRMQQEQCQSGYAKPRMCAMPCPGGGYMWQGVCAR
jgi:hypothetical protein